MTQYFGLWRLNRNIQPAPTLEAQVMQQEGFVAMIKAQLQMGRRRKHAVAGNLIPRAQIGDEFFPVPRAGLAHESCRTEH